MSNFRVGQKVVCVNELDPGGFGEEELPVRGSVYTVRCVDPRDGGIRLVEIVNYPMPYFEGYHECYFRKDRFRPVVERKTDIAIFRAMLNTTPETVGAA